MYNHEFLELYNKYIKREGADKLLDWLTKSDFFTAPASTKHHCSYTGGLVEHSVNVYHRLRRLVVTCWPENVARPSDETIAIVSLLHDLCKVNYYTVEQRNRKNPETGQWEQYPFYTVDDLLCMGHGEGSQYIVSSFMKLSRAESAAINWHMGFSDVRFKGGDSTVSKAFEKYPLAVLLHQADAQATFFDETTTGGNN